MQIDINKETISFLFPVVTGVMGGVQNILLKIIPLIIKDNKYNVRVYDYECGLVSNELKKKNIANIEYIYLDLHTQKIFNKGNETFLLFSFDFLRYVPYFNSHKNVKILNWDVYYPSWYGFYKIKKLKLPYFRNKVINLISKSNSFIFMEEISLDILKDTRILINKNIKKQIIPVPIYLQENTYSYTNKNIIKIGYIGRNVNWKIFPVKKFLKDLSEIDKKFELNIYTNDKTNFERLLSPSKNVEIKYYLNIYGKELEDIIQNKIDLGFSMGTSALDFAKFGIPTILADASHEFFFDDYKYRWLKDSNIGNLGLMIDSKFYINSLKNRKTLEKMIEEFELNASLLGEQSYSYVVQNHDIYKIKNNLYDAINRTQLNSFDLLDPYYKLIAFKTYIKNSKFKKGPYIWG